MLKRTITGAFITAAIYAVLYFSNIPGVLLCAVAVIVAFSVYELCHATDLSGNEAYLTLTLLCSVGLTLWDMPFYSQIIQVALPLAAIGAVVLMLLGKRCSLQHPVKAAVLTLLVVLLYKAFPALRGIHGGGYYLTGAVTVCFVTDVAAYLVGRSLGKHKLISKVSPNKTVEGAIGGILFAVLFMMAFGLCLDHGFALAIDYKLLAIYAVAASVVGQFGDLALSAVKRVCAIQDFGNIFPGHGGMLDRFDSHLFAVAFTLVFCYTTGGYIL